MPHRELGQHDGSPRAACLRLDNLELAIDTLHGALNAKLPRSQIDVIGTVFSQDSGSGGQQCSPAGGHQLTSLPDGEPANTH